MGTVVHISASELRDARSLLDLARTSETVIIDDASESFRLSLSPGRRASEIFADGKLAAAMDALDDDWSRDLKEIIALRKTEPDPWER